MVRWITILLLVSASACQESDSAADADTDADTDTDSDADSDSDSDSDTDSDTDPAFEIAPPALPEGPRFRSWDCPTNWSRVEHDRLLDEDGNPFSWCEPPPVPRLRLGEYITPLQDGEQESERPICDPETDGTFPLLGHTGCQPLGDPCPAGDWPEIPADLPGDRVYVKADAAAGGDGSRAAPFATVEAAVEAAAAGDVVVIAGGVYPGIVEIERDVTLWGACVQRTVIEGEGPFAGAVRGALFVNADVTLTVRNLRITGQYPGILVEAADAVVRAEGVWVHRATHHGMLVRGGRLELSGVLISEMARGENGNIGPGISVWNGAEAAIANLTSEGPCAPGLGFQYEGTQALLDNVLVRDGGALVADDTPSSVGLHLYFGAQVSGQRALFQGSRRAGIDIFGPGCDLDLSDAVIRETEPFSDDDGGGYGLDLAGGAHASLSRVLIERSRCYGIHAWDEGSSIEMTDVVVHDMRSDSGTGRFGYGLSLKQGVNAHLVRGLIENSRRYGIAVNASGTFARLEDIAVLGTRCEESTGAEGKALCIWDGARVEMRRALIEDSQAVGLGAYHENTDLSIEDLTILGTQSTTTGRFGRAMTVQSGARLTLERGLIEDNREYGISAIDPGTVLSLTDLTVTDTGSQESDGTSGWGLGASWTATVSVTRGRFASNREVGVGAFFFGTHLSLIDVTIDNTRQRGCVDLPPSDPNRCEALGAGLGIGMYHGADASVERVRVTASALAGVQIAQLASIDGNYLEVSHNLIGVNIQEVEEDYDFFEAVDGLVMSSNEVNFDVTALRIPSEPIEIEEPRPDE